jgi:biopolymer transport protein ExbD
MSNFGSSNSQEVDLNITPIIDCFTVLITFMLASASFLSIGFLEAATPGNNATEAAAEPDTEALIKMAPNHLATLKMKGKLNYTLSFDLSKKEGMDQFDTEFKKLKDSNAKVNQVLLTADDSVEYSEVAAVMDHLNQTAFPVVVG